MPMGMEMPAAQPHHHHVLPQAPQLQLHPTAVEPQPMDAGEETEEDHHPSPKRQKIEEA